MNCGLFCRDRGGESLYSEMAATMVDDFDDTDEEVRTCENLMLNFKFPPHHCAIIMMPCHGNSMVMAAIMLERMHNRVCPPICYMVAITMVICKKKVQNYPGL